ncbi:hypothetical protein VDGD_21656 [Verticillium dahliae]|nr:hypothetical protein VDGD_21656 [Verticillium dahliae]
MARRRSVRTAARAPVGLSRLDKPAEPRVHGLGHPAEALERRDDEPVARDDAALLAVGRAAKDGPARGKLVHPDVGARGGGAARGPQHGRDVRLVGVGGGGPRKVRAAVARRQAVRGLRLGRVQGAQGVEVRRRQAGQERVEEGAKVGVRGQRVGDKGGALVRVEAREQRGPGSAALGPELRRARGDDA